MFPIKFYVDPLTFSFETMQFNAFQYHNSIGTILSLDKVDMSRLYFKIWKKPQEDALVWRSSRFYDYNALIEINNLLEIDIRTFRECL